MKKSIFSFFEFSKTNYYGQISIGNFLLVIFLCFLFQSSVFSQECGTSSNQITFSQVTPGINTTGPYSLRLYIWLIRRSDGSGGLSADQLRLVLNEIRGDYAARNIFFSVACVKDLPNSTLYYDPEQSLFATEADNFTDGINLFLSSEQSAGNNGKAIIGGNRAYASAFGDPKHVASHELGHILSLYHTFRGSVCRELVPGNDPFGDPETTGDEISDTNPDSGTGYPAYPNCDNWTFFPCGTQVFSNPGPNVLRNIMSYADLNCRSIFTVKQGERMRNHIAMNKLNMVIEAGFVPESYTLSGTDRYYDTDIVVVAPATLTVNCNLHMAQGRKIIVEPGAALRVNNAQLTNWPTGGCTGGTGRWSGIVLKTDINITPATAYLVGGSIENADAGLFFDMFNNNISSPQPIVSAFSTTFKNNLSAVYFHGTSPSIPAYNATKRNTFSRCTFLIDQNFQGFTFYEMVSLFYVANSFFTGCTFTNLLQGSLPGTIHTYGINAFNSRVTVNKGSGTSSFNGFVDGISAYKEGFGNPVVSVENTQFDNCLTGIHANASNDLHLVGNRFNVGSTYFGNQFQYGLAINASTGFFVYNNHFFQNANAPNSIGVTRGISISETGSDNNSIVLNDFHLLRKSFQINGVNRSDFNPAFQGLSLLCNLNANESVAAVDVDIAPGGSIKTNQGSLSSPAGNTFSSISSFDLRNSGTDAITYFYYNVIPAQFPNQVLNVLTKPTSNGPTCSATTTSVDIVDIRDKYLQSQNDYDLLLSTYNSHLDQGNTSGLLASTQGATSTSATNLYNNLSTISPYVSETVLTAAFNRGDILSTQQRYNLLLANPDVLKSGSFMQMVRSSTQPFSDVQLQSLDQTRYSTTTARTNEEAELSTIGTLVASTITQGISIIQADSVINYTALREWWGYRNNFEANLDIADSYLAEQNTAGWQLKITNMGNGLLTPEQSTDLTNYVSYRQLTLNASLAGRDAAHLSTSEIAQVQTIALANNRYVSQLAKNLLETFYGYHFDLYTELEDRNENLNMGKNLSTNDGEQLVRVFPNPAGQEIAFEWIDTATPLAAELNVTITDTYGRYVRTFPMNDRILHIQPLLEHMTPGLYFYTLKSGTHLIQNGKLIIR